MVRYHQCTLNGQFLGRFDVVTSQVAEEALLSVFVTRPEVLDAVEFGGKSSSTFAILRRHDPCADSG